MSFFKLNPPNLSKYAVGLVLLFSSNISNAQFTETWDGGDGADQTNWNFNWADNSQPGNMQGNVHWAGTTRLTPINNFGAAGPGYRMYFDAGAGAFNLTGDSVTFYSFGGNKPVIWNQSSNTQTISLDILHGNSDNDSADTYGLDINAVNADIVVGNITGAANGGDTATRKIYFRSDDDIGTSPGDDSSKTTPGGDGQHTITVNGIISNGAVSDVRVHKEDWGVLVLNADNSYTGNTDLDVGRIEITATGDISESAAINLGGGGEERTSAEDRYAELYMTDTDGGSTISNTINMGVGDAGIGNKATPSTNRTLGSTNTSGTNTYSGTVNITGGVQLDSATGGEVVFSGDMNSVYDNTNGKASFHGGTSPTFAYQAPADGVRVVDEDGGGAGTIVFNGNAKAYTGITDVDNGTLQINTTVTGTSELDVASGATISGNSTIGATTSESTINGNIAPGTTSAAGQISTLTFGDNLNNTASATWLVDINNTSNDVVAAGGQLNVTAGASINFALTGALTKANDSGTINPYAFLIGTYADGSTTNGGGTDTWAETLYSNDPGSGAQLTSSNIPVYNGPAGYTHYELRTYWDSDGDGTPDSVVLVAVPEPSQPIALISLLSLGVFARRRKSFRR